MAAAHAKEEKDRARQRETKEKGREEIGWESQVKKENEDQGHTEASHNESQAKGEDNRTNQREGEERANSSDMEGENRDNAEKKLDPNEIIKLLKDGDKYCGGTCTCVYVYSTVWLCANMRYDLLLPFG